MPLEAGYVALQRQSMTMVMRMPVLTDYVLTPEWLDYELNYYALPKDDAIVHTTKRDYYYVLSQPLELFSLDFFSKDNESCLRMSGDPGYLKFDVEQYRYGLYISPTFTVRSSGRRST